MKNFLVILVSLHLILILEALVDAFVYKSWTKPLVKYYGKYYHILQLVLFLIIFMFGFWFGYKLSCAFVSNNLVYALELYYIPLNLTYTLLVYILFRLSIFNIIYDKYSGQTGIGKTDLWDEFCNYLHNKIKTLKFYKIITLMFDIFRILFYIGGIVLLYLRFM